MKGAVTAAMPGEGGGDDRVVMGSGWRAVAPGAAGQAFEGKVFQFSEQDGVIEQTNVAALDGEGEGFDQRGFGFGGGNEGADGQAVADQRFDIGFADAVGFSPDDLGPPMVDQGFETVALQVPADLIEAFERHHFGVGGIDDGDGGEVMIAPPIAGNVSMAPIDAGDVGMTGLGRGISG